MERGITELQEWVIENLPGSRNDEAFVRRFLLGCKMRQDVARNKLRNFNKLKESTPQWFRDRDPLNTKLKDLLEMGAFVILNEKDDQGRTLVIVRATINDPKTHPMDLVFKVGMMVLDLAMENDDSISEKGVVAIIDLDKVSLAHALQMNYNLIKRAVHSWQDCYPIPVKSIHFFNCPYKVNSIFNIFKKFMTKKLQDRMFLHGKNVLVLQKYIAQELLPTEYNGTGCSLLACSQSWHERLIENREWFLNQEMNNQMQTSLSNCTNAKPSRSQD